MSAEGIKAYQSFPEKNVLVVGDVMLDHYLIGDSNRMSPEAPVPIVDVSKEEHRLGGAANVAMNISKMGGCSFLLGIGGDDRSGAILKKKLEQNGIDNKDILIFKGRKTSLKTRVISRGRQVVRVDQETTTAIDNKQIRLVLERFDLILKSNSIDAVVLQDYNKGLLQEYLIEEIISRCRAAEIPVAVDPKKSNFLAYKGCTLFKPNLSEITAAYGYAINPLKINDLNKASSFLFKSLDHKFTVITLSQHGIYFDDGTNKEKLVYKPIEVADVCGAGDTVIAALSLGLAADMPVRDNVWLANVCGSLACQLAFVEPVGRAMIDAVVESL